MPVYFRKARKTWYIKVYIGGKRFECYSNSSGESFTKKRDALQYEPVFISTLTDKHDEVKKRVLCDDMFPLFLKDCEMRLKVNTYRGLLYPFNKYIAPFFKGMALEDVTNAYIESLNTTINKRPNNTRIQIYVAKKFVRFLRKTKGELDPDRLFLAKRHRPNENDYKIYTEDQFKLFLSAIENENHRFLFTILFYYGLRIGEALGLRWSDFSDGQCHIRRELLRYPDGKGHQMVSTPKTRNSIRDYPIIDAIFPYLEGKKLNNDYCFLSHKGPNSGCALSYSEARRLTLRYSKAAGIFRIRLHEFRHSCVSWLLSNGQNYRAVARWVGDTEAVVLSTYSHLIPGEKDQIAVFLNSGRTNQSDSKNSSRSAA